MVARNEALDATPELVNTDPYGDGWLFEVVPADAGAVDGLHGRRGVPGHACEELTRARTSGGVP